MLGLGNGPVLRILYLDGRYEGRVLVDFLMGYITGFDYWRGVGQRGVVPPAATKAYKAPQRAFYDQDWLYAGHESLTVPYHGIVSCKHKNRVGSSQYFHYRPAVLPERSVYLINQRISVASPELVLLQIAPLVTVEELAALMTEFCGGYTVIDDSLHGMVKRPPLTTKRKLQAYAQRIGSAKHVQKFATAANLAYEGSRSPMETAAALLLGMPRHRGGYGFGDLCLNAPIKLDKNAQSQFCVKELHPDVMWPERRVCIEYDSGEFHSELQRVVNDANRKNAFTHLGYTVATLTKHQLYNCQMMDVFATQLQKALKKRVRPVNGARQQTLRNALLGKCSVIRSQYEVSKRAGQTCPEAPWHSQGSQVDGVQLRAVEDARLPDVEAAGMQEGYWEEA